MDIIKALSLIGGDWVIWGLLLCSVVAVAVIIERGILLSRELKDFDSLRDSVGSRMGEDWESLGRHFSRYPGSAGRILSAAMSYAEHGPQAIEDALAAASLQEKKRLEHRLLALGTLGNNAPFVGLFGTVLGVIKAFHDLSQSGAGPEVVMEGLSEALVATAVGLFVAIPCVIGYNYYQKKVRDLLSGAEAMGKLLTARSRSSRASKH